MEDVRATLAKNLRAARAKIGISQEELADRAGIDRTYVSGIERGVRNPTISIVERLANELGIAASELLDSGSTNPPTPGASLRDR